MKRAHVSSSNLRSVGYDESLSTLEVEFSDGDIYQYFDVPSKLFAGLMSANSKGAFFNTYIKKGRFRFRKIR